jgi:Protein of unknown function, DUF481
MRITNRITCAALLLMALPVTARAQAAPPERGWKFTGQLTSVWTGGNSESSTFGLASTLRRLGEGNELKLEAGGIRTASSRKTRRAIGTAGSFVVEEDNITLKTAEAYFGRARYDRSVSKSFLVFVGADALRNTFAGISSRVVMSAGAGNIWSDTERFRFKTDYGVTYTFQEDVVENPAVKSNFPGARLSWDLRRLLSTTTRFESVLISDFNLAETDDVRADFTNSVAVMASKSISLKPSLQVLWRNRPALTEIELFAKPGTTTGIMVTTPLEKIDTFFTLALVVTL